MRPATVAVLALLALPAAADPGRWEPEKTYALMAGVLEWQDKNLSPFPKLRREYYRLLVYLAR